MNNWLQWVIQLITTIALGAIAYFLKDIKASINEKIKDNKEEINKLKQDFEDFKGDIPLRYVLRDDFIRSITGVDKQFDNMDKKLDKIYDLVAGVKKGCD